MNSRNLIFIFILLVSAQFLTTGCSYTRYRNSNSDPKNGSPIGVSEAEAIGYAQVYTEVFEPYCIACHRGGKYPLNNYVETRGLADQIKSSVFTLGSMPRDRVLPSKERRLLLAWLENGLPEFGKLPPSKPKPLEPTFTSIRDRIFSVRCGECHVPTSSYCQKATDSRATKVDPLDEYRNRESCRIELTNYQELLFGEEAQLKEFVIPGNAAESQLILAIKGSEDTSPSMPPKEDGFEWLLPEEIKVIEEWINKGALNN
ncbi:MAG: hypothetical protein RJB66_635 [Pseudomonadota bacterium]|jgi:mono/diheme cytochrome c family protein